MKHPDRLGFVLMLLLLLYPTKLARSAVRARENDVAPPGNQRSSAVPSIPSSKISFLYFVCI
jgi:hypothetical protein